MEFLEKIAASIARHRMIRAEWKIGVAVSGGADSVCLLHVLRDLCPQVALRVLHVNHQLRDAESDGDECFVRELAERLGLPLDVLRVAVAPDEQAGRKARRAFFAEMTSDRRFDRIATGHTRSDQAETVLFRLLRGSGLPGLAGIPAVSADGYVRPLIDVERGDVEAFLRRRGIAWREDRSNRDVRYSRNRLRHQLLPSLAAEWNPQIVNTLANFSEMARDEEHYWSVEIERLAGGLMERDALGELTVSAKAIHELPIAVSRRIIRKVILEAKGDLLQIDFPHVERVRALCGQAGGEGHLRVPGLEIIRSFDRVRFASLQPLSEGYSMTIRVPGRYSVPGSKGFVSLELLKIPCVTLGNELDGRILAGGFELRNWRPGDKYQPSGHNHERNIQELFQKARTPSWERSNWPIVVNDGQIVWSREFGIDARFALHADSAQTVRVSESLEVGLL